MTNTKGSTAVPSVQALSQLMSNAQGEGTLSPATAAVININDIGQKIQQGIGIDVGDVKASQVVLVAVQPDDSGSLRFAGNAQLVRDGHNLLVDAMSGTKQKDGVLMLCRYLNGTVLYPFSTIDKVVRMDQHNYDPMKGTPLYDELVVLLSTVLLKAQSFEDNGVPCRTITVIVTDGADEHSTKHNAASVAAVVRDMLRTENHIIAGIGINDGRTDFRKVFQDMGFDDKWILTPDNTQSEIRRAFQLASQSAVRASQAGANFSQAAAGGFGV